MTPAAATAACGSLRGSPGPRTAPSPPAAASHAPPVERLLRRHRRSHPRHAAPAAATATRDRRRHRRHRGRPGGAATAAGARGLALPQPHADNPACSSARCSSAVAVTKAARRPCAVTSGAWPGCYCCSCSCYSCSGVRLRRVRRPCGRFGPVYRAVHAARRGLWRTWTSRSIQARGLKGRSSEASLCGRRGWRCHARPCQQQREGAGVSCVMWSVCSPPGLATPIPVGPTPPLLGRGRPLLLRTRLVQDIGLFWCSTRLVQDIGLFWYSTRLVQDIGLFWCSTRLVQDIGLFWCSTRLVQDIGRRHQRRHCAQLRLHRRQRAARLDPRLGCGRHRGQEELGAGSAVPPRFQAHTGGRWDAAVLACC
jgi:hypothetical protein